MSAIDALDVLRSLALESRNVRLYGAQRQAVDVSIRKGKELLQSTQLYKDYAAALKRKQRKGEPS